MGDTLGSGQPGDDWGDLEPMVVHDVGFPGEEGTPEIHLPPAEDDGGEEEPPDFMLEMPDEDVPSDTAIAESAEASADPGEGHLAPQVVPVEAPEVIPVSAALEAEEPSEPPRPEEGQGPLVAADSEAVSVEEIPAPAVQASEPLAAPERAPGAAVLPLRPISLTPREGGGRLSHRDAELLLLGSAVMHLGHPPGGGREKIPLTQLGERPKELEPPIAHDPEKVLRVQKPPLMDEPPRLRREDLHELLPAPRVRTVAPEIPAAPVVVEATAPAGNLAEIQVPLPEGPEVESEPSEAPPRRAWAPKEEEPVLVPSILSGGPAGRGALLGGTSPASPEARPRAREDGGPDGSSGRERRFPWAAVVGAALAAGALGGGVVLWLGGGISPEGPSPVPRTEERDAQDGIRRKRVVSDYLDSQKQVLEDRMVTIETEIELAAREKDWSRVLVLEREKQSLVGLVQAVEARKRLLLEGGR